MMKGNKTVNQDISVQVEVTGSIASALAEMGKRVGAKTMVEAAKAGATVVASSIGARCPVDKGVLRSNLGVELNSTSKAVTATIGFLDPFQARIAYWVEHGHNNRIARTALQRFMKARRGDTIGMVPAHPFFRPGIDSAMKPASEAVMMVINNAIHSDAPNATDTNEVAA